MIGDLDRDELFLDVFGDEIVPGEEYYENEYGEAIHKDNVERYVVEEKILHVKTR